MLNFTSVKLSMHGQHIRPTPNKPIWGGKTQPSVMGHVTRSCGATGVKVTSTQSTSPTDFRLLEAPSSGEVRAEEENQWLLCRQIL